MAGGARLATIRSTTALAVQRLIEATQASRNETRDHCLFLLMFCHGLRVSEACRLKLNQVDTDSRLLHVARLKHELSTTLPFPAHPQMLRHACGFALADRGADTRLIQDYLGHRNIQHTVRYTAANPARFEKL
jgi:type 1 fimbriae regulatory protein FimB